MTKRYKNKTHRALHDMYWEGDDDGYEYSGPHKLRRNKIDGVVGGVCAGLGDYLGLDAAITRIIFVLSVLFLGFPKREYRQAKRARRENPEAPVRTANFRDVKSKYRSLETRMQDLERSVTSKEWKLRRDFRDLETK